MKELKPKWSARDFLIKKLASHKTCKQSYWQKKTMYLKLERPTFLIETDSDSRLESRQMTEVSGSTQTKMADISKSGKSTRGSIYVTVLKYTAWQFNCFNPVLLSVESEILSCERDSITNYVNQHLASTTAQILH